jgi:hypothetical protein
VVSNILSIWLSNILSNNTIFAIDGVNLFQKSVL